MSWESFQQKLNGNQTSAGWQQFQNRLAGMQNEQTQPSAGYAEFRQRLTGQREGSNAEAYRASGMDALRKDAGALRDSMTRYFENKHKASGTDAGNSYRAKANNMLSAIQKERDYFKRYASAFTQEDLQKYNAELDDYERQLRSLTGYFGNGQGMASDSTGAVWGSGYSALSNGLRSLNEGAQQVVNGKFTTQAQKDALLTQQKELLSDLDATEQYIKRNAVLFSKEEKERWDEELSGYREYLNSIGTYLNGYQAELKNPLTGGSVPTPRRTQDINGDGVADGVARGVTAKKDFEETTEKIGGVFDDFSKAETFGITANTAGETAQKAKTAAENKKVELQGVENQLSAWSAVTPKTLSEAENKEKQVRALNEREAKLEAEIAENTERAKVAQTVANAGNGYLQWQITQNEASSSGQKKRVGRDYGEIYDEMTEAYDELYNLQNQNGQYKNPDRSSLPENYANMHLVEYAEEKNAENRQKIQQAQEKFNRLAEEAAIVGAYVYQGAMKKSTGASDELTSGKGAADWYFDGNKGVDYLMSGFGDDAEYYETPEGKQKIVYAFLNEPQIQAAVLGTAGGGNPTPLGRTKDEWALLSEISDDERRAYNYLYNQEGAESAAQFLNVLLNGTVDGSVKSLEQRKAEEIAESWNKPVIRALYSGGVGLDSVLQDLGATITGQTRDMTLPELAVGQMREDSGAWGKMVIDASGSFGRMIPSLAVSAATGVPLAGALTTGITSGASGYQEGMRSVMEGGKGFSSPWQGILYGAGTGASEAGLQSLAGGIPGLKGILPEAVGEKIASGVSSGVKKAAIKYGASIVSEVLEEEAQNFLEPLLVSVATGRKYDAPSVEELIDTALSTLLLTGATGAANLPSSVNMENASINAEIYAQGKAFAEAAMMFPEGSDIYKAGKKVSDALSRDRILSGDAFRSLLQGLSLDEETTQKIRSGEFTQEDAAVLRQKPYVKFYEEAGLPAEQIQAAAAVLERVANGGATVSKADIQKLRLNTDAGAQVLSKVFGTDVKKAANNREAANAIFRAAELKYKTRTAQELYGDAELDVRKLPATQESADAILGNEQAKADFQKIFGVNLDGNYSDQVNKIVKKLEYWWMANYKTQEQETASQQVARWNAEHPQTVQDAANVQQNAENAANVQQNEQNSQLNINNAAISEYTETKTQESGGVSDVGNRVDSGVAEGVSVHGIVSLDGETAREDGRRHQVFPRRAVSQDLQNAMNQSGVVARSGFDPYSHAANEYGTIAPGENPARVVDVPASMDGKSRVSKVARTAMEAGATADATVPKIEKAVTDGLFSYDPETNEQRMEKSKAWFSNFSNAEAALDAWRDSANGKSGKARMGIDEYSNGIYLYAVLNANAKSTESAAMRERYTQQAVSVLATLQDTATEVGQMVQLNRMFKQLSPKSRIMAIRNSVEALNANLEMASGEKVKVDEGLMEALEQAMDSGDEAAVEQAEENLYRDLAAQVPTDFLAKFDAWRYLCMLGNPKTIIRNTLGNVFMMPMKATKDKLGAVMELGLDKQDRTKYVGSIYLTEEGRKMLSYAEDSFAEAKDIALGTGKYGSKNADAKLKEAIREKQNRLPGILGKAQDLVDTAMNNEVFGDAAFLKHHYAVSFAQAARARGYTAADFRNGKVSESQMESIRTYAIEQAQKATYRDFNAFSNFVRKTRFRGNSFGAKLGNRLLEGTNPFKGTPANVLVRATEYGPIGVFRAVGETLTNFYRKAKGGETISGGQIIEHLASGLTGTAVLSLGILLKNLGIVELTGAGDDDDNREGKQSWSVQIGDTSISLDWLAPAAIPFLMGVNVAEAWNDPNNSAIDVISDTLGAMYEPMLEMSMLSGIQDVLDSMTYAEGGDVEKVIYALFAQPFISYLGQGIPTLLSQTARMFDGNNEYTYTGDISGSVNKRFVKSLAKVAKKIPFVNWRQYDYVDEWGRTEDNGNVLERFFNNFVNPAYTSEVVVTDADEEIERLQVMTGEDCAPTRRSYSITVNGEKRKLSGEEYERYSKTYGEEALNMMSALMASSTYAALDDDGKVAALKDVLSVADEFGKHAALGDEYTPKTDGKLYTLSKTGVPIAEAYAAKLYREELNNSDLKASTKTANFENWVSHRDWAQTQKDAVLEAYGTFTTTMRADSGKYDELSASIGEDKALRVVEQLDGLQPESGAATVSDTQRIETIAGMNLSDGEKWDAYAAYKDDWHIPYFEDAELNPSVYAAYLRAIPEYRLTKNGTKSSAWNETTIWNWLQTTEYSNEVRQRIAKIALMSKPKEGSK